MSIDADPLRFAAEVLEAEGALLELSPGGERAQALLPGALAARTDWPEEAILVRAGSAAGPCDLAVGFGTPAFDTILGLALGDGIVSTLRLELPATTRRDLAAEAARTFLFHSRARIRFGDSEPSHAGFLVAHFGLTATSEEVHESLLCVVIDETTRAPVPALVPLLLEQIAAPGRTRPVPVEGASRVPAAWEAAQRAAVRASAERVQPFLAAMSRRRDRDAERLHAYFEALAREATDRKRGGKGAAPAAERVRAIATEYERKIRDLGPRYTLRVVLRPLTAIRLSLPVVRGAYHFQWRNAERVVPVIWNPLLQSCEELACDACGAGGFEFNVEVGGPEDRPDRGMPLRCGDCAETAGKL
jgi:hypothetical protein